MDPTAKTTILVTIDLFVIANNFAIQFLFGLQLAAVFVYTKYFSFLSVFYCYLQTITISKQILANERSNLRACEGRWLFWP